MLITIGGMCYELKGTEQDIKIAIEVMKGIRQFNSMMWLEMVSNPYYDECMPNNALSDFKDDAEIRVGYYKDILKCLGLEVEFNKVEKLSPIDL